MGETERCFVCPEGAVKTCEKCGDVSYCESHPRYHSNEESQNCFAYEVDSIEGVGRVIKASRDIAAGDEIFREREMVVGPSRSVPPVCLGCGRRVTGLVRCAGCNWPLCSLSCPEIGITNL